MEIREQNDNISSIQKYAMTAQGPYQTLSMRDVEKSGTYSGPPKYLRQRDQPLDIPLDCVRKLCDVIDTTFNEKIELWELE